MNVNVDDRAETIPTNSLIISEEKKKRTALAFTNTSAAGEVISIAFGKEAKLNEGIVLKQGVSYFDDSSNRNMFNGRIFAIATVATATLAIHEEIED